MHHHEDGAGDDTGGGPRRPGARSDSERVEEVADRIKRSIDGAIPEADPVFLDITDRPAPAARESPAATGERGGA
ncbi:hypothetical protein [Streptomyces dysideae]|uniref:hypothetical protein n=1 Tax=Streptomyces dysideae TaxID=909626 RepID=UPI000A5A710D